MLAEHEKLAREAASRDEPYDGYLLRLTELEVATRTANAISYLGKRSIDYRDHAHAQRCFSRLSDAEDWKPDAWPARNELPKAKSDRLLVAI
jgi:hypothetical protein